MPCFLQQGLQVYLGGVMIKHSYWAMLRTEGYLVRVGRGGSAGFSDIRGIKA